MTVSGGGGTINVSSVNGVTNGGVKASWDFTGTPFQGPFVDPCSQGVCNNTSSASYANAKLGIYELNTSSTKPDHYTLQSVKESTVAEAKNPVFAFINRFINTARAYTTCGFANGGSETCGAPEGPLALTLATSAGYPVNPSISFTIEWTPLGTIDPGTPPVLTHRIRPAIFRFTTPTVHPDRWWLICQRAPSAIAQKHRTG